MNGENSPLTNPVVDITKPISLRLLVLPIGTTTGHALGVDVSPKNPTVCSGEPVNFTANALACTGPFT